MSNAVLAKVKLDKVDIFRACGLVLQRVPGSDDHFHVSFPKGTTSCYARMLERRTPTTFWLTLDGHLFILREPIPGRPVRTMEKKNLNWIRTFFGDELVQRIT